MNMTQTIDVTPQSSRSAPGERHRYGGLVVGLVAALGLLVGLLVGTIRPHIAPPARTYTISVGLSQYPAPVVAAWWDRAGHPGTLDPWIAGTVRLPAVRVTIAVAYVDGPVQCTITINGAVADTQSATVPGQIALCSWAAE